MTIERTRPTEGLRLRSAILHVGVMPPAAGPARTEWCIERGLTSIKDARRNYGLALRKVLAQLPPGIDLPSTYPLHELHSEKTAIAIGSGRVEFWFGLRQRLDALHESLRQRNAKLYGAEWQVADKASRSALQSAADGFNWFDDARQDLNLEQLIDISSFTGQPTSPQSVGALVDQAHALVHSVGELVGGLFGCRITFEEDCWYDECIVSLLHLRFGTSAGLRVRYECTVCWKDPGDCGHEPGQTYTVNAARSKEGVCTVCGEAECLAHEPGAMYKIVADAKLADPYIREVTLTPRPRDPLCRITSRSVDDDSLRARLGHIPTPDEVVLDHTCMYPCTGFRDMPRAPGEIRE